MSAIRKGNEFVLSSIGKTLEAARAGSVWYFSTGNGCCANEVMQTLGCRYDVERFGALSQGSARDADLLIVNGVVTKKMAGILRETFENMPQPRFVMAVGSCACSGGAFQPEDSYATMVSAADVVPVDVFVPGCPPRPEAIMHGLIQLQKKITDGAHA